MIGELNKEVVIKTAVESHGRGEVETTWATLDTVWARIIPATSREAYRAAQVQGELQYVVWIRERDDVTAKHRIVWGSRTLRILGPPMQTIRDGGKYLELACAEVES